MLRQNLTREASQQTLLNLIDEQVKANEETFAESIKARWKTGKDPQGGEIGSYLNSSYKRMKQAINPSAGGSVDLTLSGRMGNELAINEFASLRYGIGSQVSYFSYVVDRYGLRQFNITEEEKQAFINNAWAIITLQVLNKVYA